MFKTSNGQIIRARQAWTDADGIVHPKNWHIWSTDYKASMGITEIVEQSHPDSRFYIWSQNEDLSYNQTEKSLSDVPQVDKDGNAVNDSDGNQIINDGLKSTWIKKSKNTAKDLLGPTDWQAIAKAERARDIDSDVVTYRAAVISTCGTIEGKINACNNLADFKKLFVVPSDGNAPIHNWPSV